MAWEDGEAVRSDGLLVEAARSGSRCLRFYIDRERRALAVARVRALAPDAEFNALRFEFGFSGGGLIRLLVPGENSGGLEAHKVYYNEISAEIWQG